MHRTTTLTGVVCALFCTLSGAAHAQQYRVEYSSGTGFFVEKRGGVVTNHHVVQSCDRNTIQIRNNRMDWTDANYVASDTKNDLALLRSSDLAPRVASILTANQQIKNGDSVIVMGYPGESSQTGIYRFEKSEITGFEGPSGEPQWYQFRNVVQQGNSGGPLLDQSGNVIGVVVGYAERYQVNSLNKQKTFVGSSGLAIALPVLQKFLRHNGINFSRALSYIDRTDNFLEKNARDYIVNVRCITKKTRVR